MNRLISGGVTVAFSTPPERGRGESQLILQAAGTDSGGDRYVYDRGFIVRVTHPLEFHRVSSAVLDALLSLEADATRGSLYVFTWEDHVGASHTVRFIGEIRYEETGPDRYEVEFTLEEDVPLSPPPAPASFDAALAARNDVAPVWILKLTAGGVDKWISGAVFTVPGWNGGVTTLPWVGQWGEISEQISGTLAEIRRSDFTASLLVDTSDVNNIRALAEANDLEESPVSLYLWYLGLNAATDPPREMFRGYVRDIAIPDEFTVSVTIEDETCRLEGLIGRIATPALFPTMLTNHAGRMIPIVLGQGKNLVPPCVMVDASNWYYMLDCPVSSFDSIFRKNSDGTVTDITATATKYYGTPDNSHPAFLGKAIISQPKQSAVVAPGSSTAVTTVRALYEPGGPTRGGSWSGSGVYATDSSDSTLESCYLVANPTFLQLQFPLSVSPTTRVKARVKVYSTQAFTIQIYDQSMNLLGTASPAACANGTVVDSGWFAAAGITKAYVKITFPNLAGQTYYVYAGWVDVEYTVSSSTTSYVANSADILVTASRMVGPYARTGIIYRPNAAGTVTTATVTNQANMYDADPATYGTIVSTSTVTDGTILWSRTFLAGVPGSSRRIRGCLLVTATKNAAQSASIMVRVTVNGVFQTFYCNFTAGNTVTGLTIRTPWLTVPSGATAASLLVDVSGYVTACSIYDAWWEIEADDGLCTPTRAADALLAGSSEMLTTRVNLVSPTVSGNNTTVANVGNAYDSDPSTYAVITNTIPGSLAIFQLLQKVPSLDGLKGWVRLGIVTDVSPSKMPMFSIDAVGTSLTAASGFVAGAPFYSDWLGISDLTSDRLMWSMSVYLTAASMKLYDIWIEYSAYDPSFPAQTVYSGPVLPAYYAVNGAICEQKRVIDWLTRLAFESRCFFRYSLGVPYLIYRPDSPAVTHTISACRHTGGKNVYSRRRAPISEVINTIDLRYGRDYSVSDGPEAYTGVLSAVDAPSVAAFGALSAEDIFRLNFVTDPNLAADLLAFYLAFHAPRYWDDSFEAFLDQFGATFGDTAALGFLTGSPSGLAVEAAVAPGNGEEMDVVRFTVRR